MFSYRNSLNQAPNKQTKDQEPRYGTKSGRETRRMRRSEVDEPEINSKVEWETIMALFMGQLVSGLRVRGDRVGSGGGPPDPIVKLSDL